MESESQYFIAFETVPTDIKETLCYKYPTELVVLTECFLAFIPDWRHPQTIPYQEQLSVQRNKLDVFWDNYFLVHKMTVHVNLHQQQSNHLKKDEWHQKFNCLLNMMFILM